MKISNLHFKGTVEVADYPSGFEVTPWMAELGLTQE